ncbi:FAD-binding oxidoreductase [Pseudoruegeria sp. SHC-113]|uniref:FAD-binding oxidoreductase n=1 Tax=Pseudoruegeria sp. SHC-113 TaxID=2855439 RepID=UPI0021BABDCB|nr:FAD-binding oxidoreductase [Pseudoruegeria sp. SHC-113]MCT8161577.1 FAD-binding oxidoreductase [Pseudoruegeria sp. SHC-113]
MLIEELRAALGAKGVLSGADAAPYGEDWTGKYKTHPLAVARPANTAEVSETVKIAARHGVAVVPLSGRTGLVGGGAAEGALVLSLERMNRVREIRPAARLAVVEAGVILSALHAATEPHGLTFPMTFGAKDSAMLGGLMSTNAGGSNVLRYGNTRALVLGIEVVLPDGRVLDAMSELHKDNSGYDLKDLFIGAEGTLGIITAAVVKLVELPAHRGTAFVGLERLDAALDLLNRLRSATGGAVEAFEYMPEGYMALYRKLFPQAQPPLADLHPVHILVEVGAATEDVPEKMTEVLAEMLEDGTLTDAAIAQNAAQRTALWRVRESAAELAFHRRPFVDSDISVPLDKVAAFLEAYDARLPAIDPGAETLVVSHLGDGNIHHTIWPANEDPAVHDALRALVEEITGELRGSFSAEHGIGHSKQNTMTRRKDPVAVSVMRAVKAALDPENRMNPGKVLPKD